MKKICRMIAMILILSVLLAYGAGSAEETQPRGETAREAVTHMKIGWNLGNSFDATGDWIVQYTAGENKDFETAWGNPVTPDTLMHKVKELGFNTVRIPITWRHHFNSEGRIDKAWMDRIQEVVDQAMAEGLYCIINIHHDTGSDGWLRASRGNYEKSAQLFATLWEQIALRFRDYPDTLLFEGFNEMLDEKNEWNNPASEGTETINAYNQLFVDTVRATGGNNASRNLIVCTYAAANSETALKGFRLPEDISPDHLIAEVHFYAPYEFVATEGITWTTPISVYSDFVEKTVDQTFDRIREHMGNVPLIIGEFAADDKKNTEDRIKWYNRVIRNAKDMGAICIIWDNGNGFVMGHIDRVGDKDSFPEIIEACIATAEE